MLIALTTTKAYSKEVINCTPDFKHSIFQGESSNSKMNASDKLEFALKISLKDQIYIITSRNDEKTVRIDSGQYMQFLSPGVQIKIDTKSKQYFEIVSLGLSTIIYFGKCTSLKN